jgi:hypothetical protein
MPVSLISAMTGRSADLDRSILDRVLCCERSSVSKTWEPKAGHDEGKTTAKASKTMESQGFVPGRRIDATTAQHDEF